MSVGARPGIKGQVDPAAGVRPGDAIAGGGIVAGEFTAQEQPASGWSARAYTRLFAPGAVL